MAKAERVEMPRMRDAKAKIDYEIYMVEEHLLKILYSSELFETNENRNKRSNAFVSNQESNANAMPACLPACLLVGRDVRCLFFMLFFSLVFNSVLGFHVLEFSKQHTIFIVIRWP